MAWTSPKTWAANDVLTASDMNTHVRDNLLATQTWTTYSPTWTATGGTPTIGNGTLTGAYVLYGGVCSFKMSLSVGSTTSMGTTTGWNFSLPASVTGVAHAFAVALTDASAGIFPAVAIPTTATTFQIRTAAGNALGYNLPYTWTTSDALAVSGTFQV